MNSLTLIRDLVYQERFTEALRVVYNQASKEIGLFYVKAHSGNQKPNYILSWDDRGGGLGYGNNLAYSPDCGFGRGYNLELGYDHTNRGREGGKGYGYGTGFGFLYGYSDEWACNRACYWVRA